MVGFEGSIGQLILMHPWLVDVFIVAALFAIGFRAVWPVEPRPKLVTFFLAIADVCQINPSGLTATVAEKGRLNAQAARKNGTGNPA